MTSLAARSVNDVSYVTKASSGVVQSSTGVTSTGVVRSSTDYCGSSTL